MLVTLVACGGGDDVPSAIPLDAPALALSATLHQYCNVSSPLQKAQPNESGMDYQEWGLWNNGGLMEQTGSVYAWGQAETSVFGNLQLQTNYRNYADVVGGVLRPPGLSDASAMGVMLHDVLPDQAVGCVRSVAHPVFSVRLDNNSFPSVMSVRWSGHETGELPMSELDGAVRNGFEFAANFSVPSDWGFIYFNVPKSDVVDPAATRICQLVRGSARWVCQRPKVQEHVAHWSLRLDSVKPGVYVLM